MMLPDCAFWLALAVMVIGLAGIVLPGLPGWAYLAAGLIYALPNGSRRSVR